jgi:hypothetical protein
MACHVMDLPFWALNLRHPTAVAAEGPERHPDGCPSWCKATYEFPARGEMPAVKFHWSDGGVSQFDGFQPPAKTIPDSIGHWNEWVQACKTGSPTTCNFDYSGALTETVLLGIVAYRAGTRIEWDAARLEANGDAEQYVTKQYRKGFEVVGIG